MTNMKNLTASSYHPQPNSVAGRVISYFKRIPDEELSAADICKKYDTQKSALSALLLEALDAGYLAKDGTIYSAGPNISQVDFSPMSPSPFAASTASTANAAPAKRRAPTYERIDIDMTALKVDENVPLPDGRGQVAQNKWSPILTKLAKPGQSIAFPANAKPALAAAASKYGKQHGTKYRLRKLSDTEARIWRTE